MSFTFAAPPTRAALNGFVSRAPLGVATGGGILSLGGVPSDLKREKLEKWGDSFQPDGDLLFSASLFLAATSYGPGTLTTATDNRDLNGESYDILYVPPAAFMENASRIAWVRRQPVYNKLVSVRVQDGVDNTDLLLVAGLPCRLSPQDAGLDQSGDLGSVMTSSVVMECPVVTADSGVLGAGIAIWPPLKLITFAPKSCVVIDDPAAYGQSGPILTYRVAGPGQDPGGDGHHARYLLSLA